VSGEDTKRTPNAGLLAVALVIAVGVALVSVAIAEVSYVQLPAPLIRVADESGYTGEVVRGTCGSVLIPAGCRDAAIDRTNLAAVLLGFGLVLCAVAGSALARMRWVTRKDAIVLATILIVVAIGTTLFFYQSVISYRDANSE
jgi:hypothetical protein